MAYLRLSQWPQPQLVVAKVGEQAAICRDVLERRKCNAARRSDTERVNVAVHLHEPSRRKREPRLHRSAQNLTDLGPESVPKTPRPQKDPQDSSCEKLIRQAGLHMLGAALPPCVFSKAKDICFVLAFVST